MTGCSRFGTRTSGSETSMKTSQTITPAPEDGAIWYALHRCGFLRSTSEPGRAETAPTEFAIHSAQRMGNQGRAALGFNVSEVLLPYTCPRSGRQACPDGFLVRRGVNRCVQRHDLPIS